MPVVNSEFVLKLGDSGQISVLVAANLLTKAPNKCLAILDRKPMQLVMLSFFFTKIEGLMGIHRSSCILSIKQAAKSEHDKFSKQRPKHVA